MPELPEVETVARTLSPEIKGERIVSLTCFREKNIVNPYEEFVNGVAGKNFEGVSRRAKYLIFKLAPSGYILSHLRMEGRYFYEEEGSPSRKHDILSYHLSNGYRLVYCDTRKFGRIAYLENEESLQKALGKLGPEPFSLSSEEFHNRLSLIHKPIKEAIMDQSVIAGIGNIYADESLFKAKIHPQSRACSLSEGECEALLSSIKTILQEAIDLGGSTVKSYHPKEGVSGRMQNELLAYGKSDKPCPNCGAKLKRIALNGRGTTYCPLCQKRKGERYVVGVLGPIHSGKSTLSSFLANKGYLLFDADKEAKKLYEFKSVQAKIAKLFPGSLKKDGSIDFRIIREAIAMDAEKKRSLNRIIFPLIKRKARNFILKSPQKSLIVLDAPLLFAADMGEFCDLTVLVIAPPELQKERLQKEGRDASSLLALNADYPLEEAKKKASLVIENKGSLEEFESKIARLFQ